MIRLPPTSISLSESDVQLHLREISIYQSLLQQGFTREAIQRYYASIRVPAPHGKSFSTVPQVVGTHRISSDEEGSVTQEGHALNSVNPGKSTSWTASPIDESGEMVKAADETYQMRPYRGSQAAPLKAEYMEHNSRSSRLSKQTAYDQAGGDPEDAAADTEIVDTLNSGNTGSFAPSTVELRAGSRVGFECFPHLYHDPSDEYGDQSSQRAERSSRPRDQANNGEDTSNLHSPPLASNLNLPTRHRPRQSSTLHIIRNAASPSSSGHSDDSFKSTVTKMPLADTPEFERSPRTRTMTYRPRSQTYPWVQSEADDTKDTLQPVYVEGDGASLHPTQGEFPLTSAKMEDFTVNRINSPIKEVRSTSVTRIQPSLAGTTVGTIHRQASSSTPLRAEAEEFVPLKLPSPFSATRRISSGLNSLPSNIRDASPYILHHGIVSRSSPDLAVSPPPRSSSIGSITRHLGSCFTSSPDRDFHSSPPKPRESERSPEFGRSKQGPTAPGDRGRETFKETRPGTLPRTPRIQAHIQQTDGPGTVYDDRVPAYLQPKTPADLTRGVYVTDREAAYTAPPGRIARTPATISQTLLSPTRPFEPGEESPSRRARTIRERRERELRRSAIMEEEIWGRLRNFEGDTVGGRMHWDGPGIGLTNGWRDEFGADRLGEENFDEEGFMRTPRVEPRVQGTDRTTRRRGP